MCPAYGRGFARIGDVAILLPEHPWSLDVYCDLVDDLVAGGRRLGWFSEPPGESTILLRHDVDLDLDLALGHARVVAERKHFATYYFLLRGAAYNLLDEHGLDVVTSVRGLGHRVGLHVDASLYPTTHLRGGVLREISAFEGLFGFAVDSISFHRPSVNPVDYDALRIPLPHSYERRFFEEIFYVSDSRGNWNEAALPSSGSLQLLTHPIWWVGDHQSSSERLQALLSRRGNSIKEAARAYLSNFDELTGESRLAN
jgi:hypothetical protein